jgi:ATP-dependent helicase STH1/SNF2
MVIQLRKICQHPFVYRTTDEEIVNHLRLTTQQYYEDDSELVQAALMRTAGKFELLDRILPKLFATDHKVLIFFQWTSVMDLAEEWMQSRGWKHCRLDGSTPADTRQQLLLTFNEPSSGYQAFLLSTRAGGLGLNLQSADTVILYDSDYNPHADQQAQDRAHRIGQKKEVRVLRLVTSNSVEEGIVEIAKRKLALDGQIIQAGKFDGHSSAEERDNFLRTLLDRDNDDTEEDAEPDEDTLNEIIARSDEEIKLFTQMDAERKQQEIGGLPRLIAKEELPEAYTREYPPASQLALEVIEEVTGRGQRSRNAVNYAEPDNNFDAYLLQADEDDAPRVKRDRTFKTKLASAVASQANSRAASPAKVKVDLDEDNEGGSGPSGRGRKRKEASMTASNAEDDVKPMVCGSTALEMHPLMLFHFAAAYQQKRARLAGSGDMQLEFATMRAVLNKVNNYKNALGQDIVFPFRNKVPLEVNLVFFNDTSILTDDYCLQI